MKKKRTTKKRSERARSVARVVMKNVQNRTQINLYKILKDHGYSEPVARHPQHVTGTKSFQEEIQPIVEPMRQARDMIVAAIISQQKKYVKLPLTDLAAVMKTLTHDSQLLAGNATDKVDFSAELAKIGKIIKDAKA